MIEYVIDGIRDSDINKVILYGATTIKEFSKQLEIYRATLQKYMKNLWSVGTDFCLAAATSPLLNELRKQIEYITQSNGLS